MKTGWKKILPLFLLSTVLPLGQAQEDGGGEGVETVEKLQNLEPATNAGGQALGRAESQKVVYVIPVRDDIMPPILYVIRRDG